MKLNNYHGSLDIPTPQNYWIKHNLELQYNITIYILYTHNKAILYVYIHFLF